jgi:hypothetical protein
VKKIRFTMRAKRAIRRDVTYAMRKGAVTAGVDLKLEEDRGFFESQYTGSVEGEDALVDAYVVAVKKYAAHFENDE